VTTAQQDTVSIHDFTVTIDTRACEGDKVVLRLDRVGQSTLHVPCSAQQLVWLLNDPEYFSNGFKFTMFKRIADHRKDGWSFDRIAVELGVDADWAREIYDAAIAAMPDGAVA
jgi:hypothetical protein